MTEGMVPYTFLNDVIPVEDTEPLGPGQYQAVHFMVPVDQLSWYLQKIEVWFDDRDEVILVASGQSMEGKGFIVMEWEECEIDPLFLKILDHEDAVMDVCVYIRSEEVE